MEYGGILPGLSGPIQGAAQFVEQCAHCFADCGKSYYVSTLGAIYCNLCALAYSETFKASKGT